MPLPLLWIAIAGGSAALRIGKSVKAKSDYDQAEYVNSKAYNIQKKAADGLNECRKNCGTALGTLGETKILVLDEGIKPFVKEFEKLNHISLSKSAGLNELQKIVLDKASFAQLKEIQGMATSIATGAGAGAIAGATTAFGAYGAASTFALASTGTAISSLSGAAATNATLAFFGGGAIKAGGLGMIAGGYVLGGLIAGPALAVFGSMVGAKASAALDDAYSNLAQAREYAQEMSVASTACIGIRKRSDMFTRFLLQLNATFEPLVYEMTQIIKTKGADYRKFSKGEKEVVAEAMTLAGAIKAVIDTPILDDSGKLTKQSEKIIQNTRRQIEMSEDV